ncbi:hypothetical protein GGI10_003762 [Coemansia sp. RSA 2530]|nr:hypothetical protein GGI10_003762 [Coemansia sp. RSA 2530]
MGADDFSHGKPADTTQAASELVKFAGEESEVLQQGEGAIDKDAVPDPDSPAYYEYFCGQGIAEEVCIVFCGLRYITEQYVARQWTLQDVDMAEASLRTHNFGFTEYPFPKHLFLKFIAENAGYFPVRIEALREGSVVYPHMPVFQITAKDEYSSLITYLETVLLMAWYPSTVATLSRLSRAVIEDHYRESVDEDGRWTLEIRMHDFGFRECTCVGQSMIGGAAHLLGFDGTDTLSAAFYAQYRLNNGQPMATSIPATKH